MYRQIAALAATTTLVAASSAGAATEPQLRANARALVRHNDLRMSAPTHRGTIEFTIKGSEDYGTDKMSALVEQAAKRLGIRGAFGEGPELIDDTQQRIAMLNTGAGRHAGRARTP